MSPVDFDTEVIRRSFELPVLVDFWAPWCAPCRALTPVLDRVAESRMGFFHLVKVNTEEQPEIAERFRIRSIPNVKLFVDGEVLHEFSGAMSEPMVEEWLDRALPSPQRARIKQAKAWIEAGRLADAVGVLSEVVAAEPGNTEAAILLARLQLWTDHRAAVETVAAIGPGCDGYSEAEAVRTLSRLIDIADGAVDIAEGPVQGAYRAAAEQVKNRDFRGALAGFIEVVRKARSYDEDGARRASVAIFAFLGDDHELTREFRGALSSALYV